MLIGITLPFSPFVNTHLYRRIGINHDHKPPICVKRHIFCNRKNVSRVARFLSVRIFQCPVFKNSCFIRKTTIREGIISGCLNRFHGARCVTSVKRDGVIFALYIPRTPCPLWIAFKIGLIPGGDIYDSILGPGRPILIKYE